jgi:hypothetical protein
MIIKKFLYALLIKLGSGLILNKLILPNDIPYKKIELKFLVI